MFVGRELSGTTVVTRGDEIAQKFQRGKLDKQGQWRSQQQQLRVSPHFRLLLLCCCSLQAARFRCDRFLRFSPVWGEKHESPGDSCSLPTVGMLNVGIYNGQ